MKKGLKILGLGVLVAILAAGAFAAYVAMTGLPRFAPRRLQIKVEGTPEKVDRGRKFAGLLCATCHMDPTTRKLTGKRQADTPPQFGIVFSKNITQDKNKGIGSWTDGELIYFLRTGIDRNGQYVPPYMVKLPHLSDDDLEAIVAFLRSDDPLVAPAAVDPPGSTQPSFLIKFLSRTMFGPLPYPMQRIVAPPASDRLAYGRYLSDSLGCFTCHSADFKTMKELDPEKSAGYMGGGNELRDQSGAIIRSANITFDEETGIGQWSEADFARAVRDGVRPDKSVLLYPMEMMPELTEEDAGALYAYLKTVPKLRHAVARQQHAALADASEGKKLYYKYGCIACHGSTGVGLADLRQATQHYPNDKLLAAWIRNAGTFKPGTKMPTWEGVIAESEYPALIAYVKELGKANPARPPASEAGSATSDRTQTDLREIVGRAPKLPLEAVELKVQPPREGWQLGMVSWIAVDRTGLIFLLQRGDNADPIVVLDRAGHVLRSWGKSMYTMPHAIRIDPQGNIWTTDAATSMVYKFTPHGEKLMEIAVGGQPSPCMDQQIFPESERASEANNFCGTTDIAFAPNGHVFIADGYANDRILEYSADGKRLTEWGSAGTGPVQFRLPHSIEIDEGGVIYVSDRENGRIQRFDLKGKYLGEWPHLGRIFSLKVRAGAIWLATQPLELPNLSPGWILKLDRATGKLLGYVEITGGHGMDVLDNGELVVGPGPNGAGSQWFRPTS